MRTHETKVIPGSKLFIDFPYPKCGLILCLSSLRKFIFFNYDFSLVDSRGMNAYIFIRLVKRVGSVD